MTVYRILITDDDGVVSETFYTSEDLEDIKDVLENGLAVYETRAEHDEANGED